MREMSTRGGSAREKADAQWFATTHWSVVLRAQSPDTPEAAEALNRLCTTYLRPVQNFIRLRWHNEAESEDLTQEFFARFLAKDYVRLARQERGRFRTFLLTAVKNFLINEREKTLTQKRGAG